MVNDRGRGDMSLFRAGDAQGMIAQEDAPRSFPFGIVTPSPSRWTVRVGFTLSRTTVRLTPPVATRAEQPGYVQDRGGAKGK